MKTFFRQLVRLAAGTLLLLLAGTASAQTVGVQFYREGETVRVERAELTASPSIEAAVKALMAGPTPAEAAQGIVTAIPAGTTIAGLTVTGDLVVLDLSPEVLAAFDEGTLTAIADQFRLTLINWPDVRSIRLTCNGLLLSTYLPQVAPVKRAPAQIPAGITTAVGLVGKNVTIGPSHGRRWNGSGWYWQRSDPCGLGEAVLEDTNSIRLSQFVYEYLAQDGAQVQAHRQLMNESDCCHPDTGMPWWKMCAQSWLKQAGYPCSIWASYSGNCGAETATSRSSDDIRARPLFADYHGSDLYIAYHTNAAGGTGTETFHDSTRDYQAHAAASYNLAVAVNDNIVQGIRELYDASWANRGVKDSEGAFGEIRIPNQPAILIELAFHDRCDRDAIYLTDNYFRSVAGWSIYRGVCQYFGVTPTWDKYSCEYVSDTIPSTMLPGQSYNVGVTFRNRGVLWSSARNFRLGAANDSDPFTTNNRVNIAGEVRPGATFTFNFIMTAPTVPGIYTTDWRMVRDGVTWFGPTHAEQVTVSGADTAPVITNHPSNQNAAGGATVVFTVDAGGTPPLSYQWQKNEGDLSDGGKISGANGPTLQIANAALTDNGNYRCIVTNDFGTAVSNPATLNVVTGPSVWIVETRDGGQNFSTHFSKIGAWIDVTGKSTAPGCTPNIGHIYTSATLPGRSAIYRFTPGSSGAWRVYVTWRSSTNACPTTNHVVTHAGGSTTVVLNQTTNPNVWNLLGEYTLNAGTQYTVTQTTDPVSVTGIIRSDAVKWERVVIDPPAISQHPAASRVCPGGTATFSVSASGTGTLSYRWQKGGTNLNDVGHYSGVTTSTLTIAGVDANDAASYRCLVSNDGGSTPSNGADLTLKNATTVGEQPQPQSVAPGETATFSVAAGGEGTLGYKWQKNEVDLADDGRIGGTSTPALTIGSVTASDAGDYRCVVTGECGTTPSDSARLTVVPPRQVPGDVDGDRDVDLEDFGVVQACMTAPDEAQDDPACIRAKLDSDDDVDDVDIGLFVGCLTGPDQPGDVDCTGL